MYDSINSLLFIGLIVLIVICVGYYRSPGRKGAAGESRIANIIYSSLNNTLRGYVMQNIYVPRADGGTSEIDVLLISNKGIFVFESKNFAGYIFGSENRNQWTVTLYAGKNWFGGNKIEKHHFYNPIWQNNTHIRCLQNVIHTDAPFYSVVVFSNRGKLKSISYYSDNVRVLQTRDLHSYLSVVKRSYSDVLSDTDVELLHEQLVAYTHSNAETKAAHIANIHYRNDNPQVCPRCGGKLVVRTARKGTNAGKQFYGCSNYPKCKFTKSIN